MSLERSKEDWHRQDRPRLTSLLTSSNIANQFPQRISPEKEEEKPSGDEEKPGEERAEEEPGTGEEQGS